MNWWLFIDILGVWQWIVPFQLREITWLLHLRRYQFEFIGLVNIVFVEMFLFLKKSLIAFVQILLISYLCEFFVVFWWLNGGPLNIFHCIRQFSWLFTNLANEVLLVLWNRKSSLHLCNSGNLVFDLEDMNHMTSVDIYMLVDLGCTNLI